MRLHRSTWLDLVKLGWPVSATLLVRVTMRTVDLLVVGLVVGAAGVAAVGIGDAAARIVLMTALGLGAGAIATVSQRLGAGSQAGADVAATQTLVLAVLVGSPLSLLGWWGAPAFFAVLGAEPGVADLGVLYLRVVIVSAVPRMIAILLTRVLQGSGDTRTPFLIRATGTGVNILLTVLLVAGLGGLPRMGVLGAAIGTAVGNGVSAALLIAGLASGRWAVGFSRAGVWAPATARRIVRIGLPQIIERNIHAVAMIPLNAIVLVFGTAANAGFQVGRRIMLYALLPSRGLATAASTFVGHRVGAGEADDGERYGRGAVSLAVAVTLAVVAPLFAGAPAVAGMFVNEPEALGLATAWVRVYAAVTVLRGVFGVLRGAMQGAGDTRSPLYASALGVTGFTLAFSYLAGIRLGAGLPGIFAGVVLDPVVRTALLYRWFDRGRWRRALDTAEDTAPAAASLPGT